MTQLMSLAKDDECAANVKWDYAPPIKQYIATAPHTYETESFTFPPSKVI